MIITRILNALMTTRVLNALMTTEYDAYWGSNTVTTIGRHIYLAGGLFEEDKFFASLL